MDQLFENLCLMFVFFLFITYGFLLLICLESARKKTAAGRAHKYFIKYQSGNDSQRTDDTGGYNQPSSVLFSPRREDVM